MDNDKPKYSFIDFLKERGEYFKFRSYKFPNWLGIVTGIIFITVINMGMEMFSASNIFFGSLLLTGFMYLVRRDYVLKNPNHKNNGESHKVTNIKVNENQPVKDRFKISKKEFKHWYVNNKKFSILIPGLLAFFLGGVANLIWFIFLYLVLVIILFFVYKDTPKAH